MTLHLNIIGLLLIGLAIVHAAFPKYFQWKNELSLLSLFNRQMVYVHTLFIALFLFFIGLLCLTSHEELQTTLLGKKLIFGLAVFGIVRLLVQFVGYSPKLWIGKTFETLIHIMFVLFWAYFSLVFIVMYLM